MKHIITSLVVPALISPILVCADKGKVPDEPFYPWKADNFAIEEPIGGKQGNAERGKQLALDRKKGNCIACHMLPVEDAEFPGQLGPPLVAIGTRYSPAQIRLRVANDQLINPATIMPPYYIDPNELNNVKKKFRGKTILSAQETEDVVAYLSSLK